MPEPTKLLSANSFATLTAERDAALARVAELEAAINSRAAQHNSIADHAHKLADERDAHAAELAELRAVVREIDTQVATQRGHELVDRLLSQPQGERGAQILKRRDWLLGRLMALNTVRLSQGLLSGEFLRLWELTLNELAAIDGEQPE